MKFPKVCCLLIVALIFLANRIKAFPNKSGFFLPDSVQEMRLSFQMIKNLIIIPVIINDSIQVNLILDTGCRNLVLFGKRFEKLFKTDPRHSITFSGLGAGDAVKGKLSLNNNVTIKSIQGQGVPVVVVPDKNLFSLYKNVHGIIGYDVFLRFEIEINVGSKQLTFRPAASATAPANFAQVPLNVIDSRPMMNASIVFDKQTKQSCQLMIDTGSSLGLLLKTTDIEKFDHYGSSEAIIGRGLNGPLKGFETLTDSVEFMGFGLNDVRASIIESPWHNYASIGMEILKNYVVVLNYCKAYACFKKLAA